MHETQPMSAASRRTADIDLVTRAAAGDPTAVETIVRGNNRLLFRTARGILHDDEAQDAVQETYLRAFTRLHTYRGDASLGTWLARIAINVASDMRRRRKVTIPLALMTDDGEIDTDIGSTPASALPETLAGGSEMRALLQSTIEELPPIYRSVFILRAVEEMSVADAAYCLGVSADTVKTRYLRARALLRERLASRVESGAHDTFAFAGARCDSVLTNVMTTLAALDLLRAG